MSAAPFRHVITDITRQEYETQKTHADSAAPSTRSPAAAAEHFSPPLLLMWQRRREARKLSARPSRVQTSFILRGGSRTELCQRTAMAPDCAHLSQRVSPSIDDGRAFERRSEARTA
jgi:hypothetical protein